MESARSICSERGISGSNETDEGRKYERNSQHYSISTDHSTSDFIMEVSFDMEFRYISIIFIDVKSPAGLEPVMLRLSRLQFVCVTCS
jgi:hypothetical protein